MGWGHEFGLGKNMSIQRKRDFVSSNHHMGPEDMRVGEKSKSGIRGKSVLIQRKRWIFRAKSSRGSR